MAIDPDILTQIKKLSLEELTEARSSLRTIYTLGSCFGILIMTVGLVIGLSNFISFLVCTILVFIIAEVVTTIEDTMTHVKDRINTLSSDK